MDVDYREEPYRPQYKERDSQSATCDNSPGAGVKELTDHVGGLRPTIHGNSHSVFSPVGSAAGPQHPAAAAYHLTKDRGSP